MAKIKRDPKAVALAQEILDHYDPESVEDMDEALKEIFGPLFESMLQGELSNHLGDSSNSKEAKSTTNRRNGYMVLTGITSVYRLKNSNMHSKLLIFQFY